ncbi:hypothetical protein D3C81_2079760 [compost metagenome]
MSDKINVGIKPFLKMPLTGIGYGRVDLESKGIALMVGVTLESILEFSLTNSIFFSVHSFIPPENILIF